jgi:hypothetical protein
MVLIIEAGRLILVGVKPLFNETWSTVYMHLLKALMIIRWPDENCRQELATI